MDNSSIVKVSTLIHAPVSDVWKALTDPRLIKQYLFGTEAVTNWKVGEPIYWRGQWQGKSYEDKGTVLKFEPEKAIETTYWSSMGGLPDTPENYKKVSYTLEPENGGTRVTLTQDNNASEDDRNHSEQNWKMVLDGLKQLVEKQRVG